MTYRIMENLIIWISANERQRKNNNRCPQKPVVTKQKDIVALVYASPKPIIQCAKFTLQSYHLFIWPYLELSVQT